MPRTTIDLDPSVLRQAKRLARSAGKTLSQVVSELLAVALGDRREQDPPQSLSWTSKPMRARLDLGDKDALYAALEHE